MRRNLHEAENRRFRTQRQQSCRDQTHNENSAQAETRQSQGEKEPVYRRLQPCFHSALVYSHSRTKPLWYSLSTVSTSLPVPTISTPPHAPHPCNQTL